MYIHHDGQIVIKDYRNYGTKINAWNLVHIPVETFTSRACIVQFLKCI